ncbi:hypothetical protein Misp01_74800 [Microtetraspora sp. NBRC 13810]|uniref:GNAT family N-acetyltransferase n=1 Tax=Microtetraspora sp. NBRC 13810 TaxID=3030990 RepID=UPI0024A44637|nr:GNAT family N-acetyltransferase [Microtetraspora sp. NBRC 13810]GLW12352.1 hypothetical protein Misp01_74800 [Microtetraspora sp. NBRC 13810]
MELTTVVSASRPDLGRQVEEVFSVGWPEFIFHEATVKQYMDRAGDFFSAFNLLLLDENDHIAAGGWGVPLTWDGTVAGLPAGYTDALVRSVEQHERGTRPDTFVLMAAQVREGLQGRGLAAELLDRLRDRALTEGLTRVIAPVRPTLKARYPLTEMARFAGWTRSDGTPLDPWLRIHHRMGARILCPAERSMVVRGTVAEWEQWTDMAFPDSGAYVVPGALAPVLIDREADTGEYAEPNVWMRHV